METVVSSLSAELLRAQTHIWRETFSFKNSASLKCAVELGIPDAIQEHGKPMNLSELTSALPINPSKAPYIHRLMRILVNAGFFSQQKEGFALTSAGRLLLKDDPLNAKAFVLLVLDPSMMNAWNALKDWFQNDDLAPFDTAHGKGFWDYTACEPKLGKLFDEAMASDSLLTTKVLVTDCKYVFEGLTSLVDVGGGNGAVARAIAKTFPNLKCTVYDLPHVVADQEGEGNLDFVAGDMFDKIPSANAILLKWILDCWSIEDCLKILKNCRRAIPGRERGGKVIVIDMVMDSPEQDNETTEAQISSDMQAVVLLRGGEKTEEELAMLFRDAGFTSYQIFPVLGTRSLIELYP